MSQETIIASFAGSIKASRETYSEAHDADVGDFLSGSIGQYYRSFVSKYHYGVNRFALIFDLSVLPESADIIDVTLRVYINSINSDTDFDVTIVEGTFGSSITYDDFNEFGIISYGAITTIGISAHEWVEITVNAAGLLKINEQMPDIKLGVISSRDISETVPVGEEFITPHGYLADNPPELIITYSDWPNDRYPDDPGFPITGRIDSDTQAVIQSYIEDLTAGVGQMTDGDANIDFQDPDNYITWDGTSEKISYDSANDRVKFNNLVSVYSITLEGYLICNNLWVTTAIDVQGDTPSLVIGDANFSDTAYASEQGSLTDDELWHDANDGTGAPGTDEALMYQLDSDGDFKVEIDIGAGVKTATLVDFSEI